MRILVFSQYYYPEPFKIHEICEELVKRGNEVTVITGRPNYPDGDLFEGYGNENKMNEVINGVNVIRTKIVLRGHNPLSLMRNYFSYPLLAKKEIKKLNKEFDIVFVYQLSPVFMIKPALYYKKKFKKKVYIYCLDLWPESLKVLHISEKNIIFKFIKRICNKIYQQCDFISVTSPAFIEYLNKENDVNIDKINYVPQHGENLFLQVTPYQKQDKLNITFAGNIGKAQDFDCLIKAICQIPNSYYNRFMITIIGSGSYEEILKNKVKEHKLESIFKFEGRKSVENLIPYYNNTSLFLLSLEKNSSIGKTIPSKLQTYMSAGRGIIGSIDGTSSKIIKKAQSGVTCQAGDYRKLAQIIIDLLNDDSLLEKYAINSRKYFLNNFTLEKCTNKIIKKLNELI